MLQTLSTLDDVQRMYHWFGLMRETQPVRRDESSGCWHVFRYDDVRTVITEDATFSSERKRPGAFARTAEGTTNAQVRMGRSILTMDPPEHRQYRNLVSSAFTPRAIDQLRGRVAHITQHLSDEAREPGKMDFATEIAFPLPTSVIAELLGVPISDRPLFQRWADALLSRQVRDAEFFRPQDEPRDHPDMQRISHTFEEMSDYFRQRLEERKRTPGEDMMSGLLNASIDRERLSMEDTISFCTILLLAGHVTTTKLLSQAIRCFDEHPEPLEQVRRHPKLIPQAGEEMLRYASPVWRLIPHASRPLPHYHN